MLDAITIQGYKSIRNLENFRLRKLNVLVGENGAGKSNFLGAFEALRKLTDVDGVQELSKTFDSNCFFGGHEATGKININIRSNVDRYELELCAEDERFFVYEKAFSLGQNGKDQLKRVNVNPRNSLLGALERDLLVNLSPGLIRCVAEPLNASRLYKLRCPEMEKAARSCLRSESSEILDEHAERLAPFLYDLRQRKPNSYREIVRCLRLALPSFDDFVLTPDEQGLVQLNWLGRVPLSRTFSPEALSSGAFRFAYFATALLQPNLPPLLLIDNPENELHPTALGLLVELIKAASERTQVIVATQSPEILDHLQPEDVIVVRREAGASIFHRLARPDLNVWLEDYALGELWRRNIVS